MSGTALTLFPVESTAAVQDRRDARADQPPAGHVVPDVGLRHRVGRPARPGRQRAHRGRQPARLDLLRPAAGRTCRWARSAAAAVAASRSARSTSLGRWPTRPATRAGSSTHRAGGAPNPDPSYPAYEPYDPANTPQASIGEYGLNVNNGNIASPQTFRDFMAYGGPSWISPYHYGLLLDNDRLTPTTVGIDHPWWKDLVWEEIRKWPPIPEPDPPFDLELPVFPPSRLQDVISLIVKVERGKVTEVMHVARTRAHTGLRGRGRDVVHRSPARRGERRSSPRAPCCDWTPPPPGAAVVATARSRRPTWPRRSCPTSRRAPASRSPTGTRSCGVETRPASRRASRATDVKVDRRGNTTVSWDSSGGVAEFWLRWSRDGETLAVGDDRAERAEGADRCRSASARRRPAAGRRPRRLLLELLRVAGDHGSRSRPRKASSCTRCDGYTYAAGQSVRLWASVVDAPDDVTAEAVWLVDGKEVARGLDAFVTLEAGERTVSLRLGDRGRPTSVSVTVTSE